MKGVLADGVVSEREAELLRDWCAANRAAVAQWPGSILAKRLHQIFADGVVEEEERQDLLGLLQDIVGGKTGILFGLTTSSKLPLDEPPPPVRFVTKVFVFTGTFAFGPRFACERQVERLGGRCDPRVTRKTDFLVVGTFGSGGWVQAAFGRKIEQALRVREQGFPIAIISEDHWANAL